MEIGWRSFISSVADCPLPDLAGSGGSFHPCTPKRTPPAPIFDLTPERFFSLDSRQGIGIGQNVMGAPGRVELPTNGLGNRCSIHLSYGAGCLITHHFTTRLSYVSLLPSLTACIRSSSAVRPFSPRLTPS